jgi:hypothetical protein
MPQIFLDCPHCQSLSVGMTLCSRQLTKDADGIAFAQCNKCSRPVTAIMKIQDTTPHQWTAVQGDLVDGRGVRILHVFPKQSITVAPEHIDAEVAKIFIQSENARKRGDRHVAGMGFRKTLDIALKLFDARSRATFTAASIF